MPGAYQLQYALKIAGDLRKYHNTCIQELKKRRTTTKRKRDMIENADSHQYSIKTV
jgi:hypothetical protein